MMGHKTKVQPKDLPTTRHSYLVLVLCIWLTPAPAEVIAIVGGTVHTVGKQGTLEDATVLIEDGRIVTVGRNVTVPEDARIIDASGKVVTPGLFDSYSHFGVREVSLAEETVDTKYAGDRYTAAFDVTDAINPRV